jgi:hypothetical protein
MTDKVNRTKDFVWNSPEWWSWFTSRKRCPAIETLKRHLKSYSSFIVFHACRPLDVSSFYSSGLQISDLDELNEVARSIYLAPGGPHVTESSFDAVLESIDRSDHGKVYVCLDDRELIEYCGTYLIYGSEHISGIGARLHAKHGYPYQQLLKRVGKPTIIRLRLSSDSVSGDKFEELAEHLNCSWEEYHKMPSPPIDSFSFMLRNPIASENVLSHIHPAEIPDPLFQNRVYKYRDELLARR